MEQRLIFALWHPRDLFDLALRERLAAAGADWIQLNVADEPVAEAMRLTHFGAPVDSFVTLPGTTDVAAALAALSEGADWCTGWRVESEEPIIPPSVPDGERLDALANLAVLRVPEGQAYDEWRSIWKNDHTGVAIDTQDTFGYVQNRVIEALTEDPTGVAAIVEEHFPMAAITDSHAFYGSGGDQAELERRMTLMFTSITRFGADRHLDLVPTSRYRWRLD